MKFINKFKNEQGAVIVEATISLSFFIFTIVILLMIINICAVQMKVGTTLCGVAEDISKFSYIYEKTGLSGKRAEANVKSSDAREFISDLESCIDTMNIRDAGETVVNAVNNEELLNSLLCLVGSTATDRLTNGAMELVTQELFKARVSTESESATDYLRRIGIVNENGSATGIDFSDSHFCENCTEEDGGDIIVVAKYKIKVLEVFGYDYNFEIQQCAATKIWTIPDEE